MAGQGNMTSARPPRIAVVTGGARGIGMAVATRLDAAGARVAIWDVDVDEARRAAARLRDASAVPADVTDSASVAAAVTETERRLGPVDVLVNNAGIDRVQPFLDSDEATWRRIVDVNLLGMLRCCHALVGGMVARGYGRVVNLGSDAGKVGSSGEAVYSATKGGVIAFTKALAREVATTGVTVNCVCPGPTDTALLGQVAEANPKLREALARAIPMRRVASPDDIAPAVVFLAGDTAGYITGQALSVSGGMTMS